MFPPLRGFWCPLPASRAGTGTVPEWSCILVKGGIWAVGEEGWGRRRWVPGCSGGFLIPGKVLGRASLSVLSIWRLPHFLNSRHRRADLLRSSRRRPGQGLREGVLLPLHQALLPPLGTEPERVVLSPSCTLGGAHVTVKQMLKQGCWWNQCMPFLATRHSGQAATACTCWTGTWLSLPWGHRTPEGQVPRHVHPAPYPRPPGVGAWAHFQPCEQRTLLRPWPIVWGCT